MTAASMPVVQVAFSTLDLERTVTWYQDVLGFRPAGEMRGASGPQVAAMMGLPAVSCDMRWLVDTSDFFQLEFFQFREPAPKPGVRRPAAGRSRAVRPGNPQHRLRLPDRRRL